MEHQKHVVCVGQALVDCITRGMEEKPYKKKCISGGLYLVKIQEVMP